MVSLNGPDFPKPGNRAERRSRSLVSFQNTWVTICWKSIRDYLSSDAKNMLPTQALKAHTSVRLIACNVSAGSCQNSLWYLDINHISKATRLKWVTYMHCINIERLFFFILHVKNHFGFYSFYFSQSPERSASELKRGAARISRFGVRHGWSQPAKLLQEVCLSLD